MHTMLGLILGSFEWKISDLGFCGIMEVERDGEDDEEYLDL